MAVNLAAIRDLLLPGLRGVEGKYEQIPSQWDKVYTRHTSQDGFGAHRRDALPRPRATEDRRRPDPVRQPAGERFIFNQEHREIGLGYAMTRKSIDDNLYKSQFHPSNLGLVESYQQTKELYGANILNTGNVYDPTIGGDGVALFAPNHPIDGGVYSNIAVDAGRSERSVTCSTA